MHVPCHKVSPGPAPCAPSAPSCYPVKTYVGRTAPILRPALRPERLQRRAHARTVQPGMASLASLRWRQTTYGETRGVNVVYRTRTGVMKPNNACSRRNRTVAPIRYARPGILPGNEWACTIPGRAAPSPRQFSLRLERTSASSIESRAQSSRVRPPGITKPRSVALQDEPRVLKISSAGLGGTHPKVEHSAVAPHHPSIVVCVQLKKQSPVLGAGLELLGSRIAVAAAVPAIQTIAGKLAFKFHFVALHRPWQTNELMFWEALEWGVSNPARSLVAVVLIGAGSIPWPRPQRESARAA
jgi:hypothetical protein